MEDEAFERKSQLTWSPDGQQLDIAKTIMAFANTEGGSILIEAFEGDERMLDSARLEDYVNRYVSPPIRGLRTEKRESGHWLIYVEKSAFAPHVISHVGSYTKKGKQVPAFHLGQVYVRHSSKSEPATSEDLHRLIRESVSSWLSELGRAVEKVGIGSPGAVGMPIRLVEGGPSLAISITETHPYTASEIGEAIGKTAAWVGKLIHELGWRADPSLCRELGGFKQPHYRYSKLTFDKVVKFMKDNPYYNPYSRNFKDR